MTINISIPDVGPNLHPQITVLGVGGSGGNAVNNMINSNLEGVDFLIANTDAQSLQISNCKNKIQLGVKSTRGLGAGMRPDIGKQAAEEALNEISEKLEGSHMLFIAAGMGGGTGTGAAPVIAKLARALEKVPGTYFVDSQVPEEFLRDRQLLLVPKAELLQLESLIAEAIDYARGQFGGFFGEDEFRYIKDRQTEYILIGPKQEGLAD